MFSLALSQQMLEIQAICESIVGVKACLIEKVGSPAYKDSLS